MRQILTIGGIDLELILTIPQIPRPDEKVLGNFIGRLPGGPAANFACAASRLGLDVAAHCQVGDDEGGRLIIDQLETYGVDTSLVEVMLGQATPFALILVDPSGEKMTITVPTFQAIMPDNEQTFLTLAQTAHTHDTEVMIAIEPDVCRNRNKLERILSQTDIASFNQFGFRAAAGVEPSVEAAQSLLAYGPHTVIVTLGEQGALAVNRDGAVVQPGLNVPVADCTICQRSSCPLGHSVRSSWTTTKNRRSRGFSGESDLIALLTIYPYPNLRLFVSICGSDGPWHR